MSEIKLTDANFAEEVENSKTPVLVDFFAEWCGPCKMLGPVIEELAKDFAGKVKVGKLNVDENPQTSQKYGVMSIPTLLFIKDGKVMSSLVGFRPKEKIVEELNSLLK